MINIHCDLLSKVDEDELWLMMHIAKRASKNLFCFPSNELLCEDTGWDIKKIQRIKKSLVKKNLLSIKMRVSDKKQTSNGYQVETDLLSVYVPGKEIGRAETATSRNPSEGTSGEAKQDNEVLSTEVLSTEVNSSPLPPKGEKGSDESESSFEKENTNTVLADLDGRVIEFRRAVLDAGGTIYTQKMLEHFIEYWTEPNRAPKPKMKFEKEKHFEFKRRLKWWAENPRRKNDGYPVYLTGNAKTIAEKKAAFKEMLRPFIPRYGTEFLNSFYQTWSSPENIPDPQFLMWEKEPFWDLGNTLAKWHTTWLKRNQNQR